MFELRCEKHGLLGEFEHEQGAATAVCSICVEEARLAAQGQAVASAKHKKLGPVETLAHVGAALEEATTRVQREHRLVPKEAHKKEATKEHAKSTKKEETKKKKR